MKVTPTEAREALAAVRTIQVRTRRALSLAGGGEVLMIWGVVWLVGYLGGYFLEGEVAGRLWAVADVLGGIATLVVVLRAERGGRDPLGPRIGALWITLIGFALLWIWVAQPGSGAELGFLLSTFAMFGYVVMGLWLDLVFLVVGLAVTAIATVAYVWFRTDFNLWMALLGGGTLFGSGLYVRRRWR